MNLVNTNSTNMEMIKFFIRSFKPNYIIHVTPKNKIMTFDERLIHDFQTNITDSEDFVGLDIIELATKHRRYSREFAQVLSGLLNDCGTGLCAVNASFKDGGYLKIPVIYILLIMVEAKIVGSNQIKEIKIFNYIEMAKFLSNTFNENMFKPLIKLTDIFKHSMVDKSLYCAFESLKPFATFISSETATKINQQQLATVIFPFHRAKSDEVTPRFVNEFLRSTGYIEYDKNRKIKELSLDIINRVTNKPLIPFNSLYRNCIIRLH